MRRAALFVLLSTASCSALRWPNYAFRRSSSVRLSEQEPAVGGPVPAANTAAIVLADGRQLYVNPRGQVGVAKECEFTNTEASRRTWIMTPSGEIALPDGRQLYVNRDGWASAELEGRRPNTDSSRRLWTGQFDLACAGEGTASEIKLRDGRKLYVNAEGWASAVEPEEETVPDRLVWYRSMIGEDVWRQIEEEMARPKYRVGEEVWFVGPPDGARISGSFGAKIGKLGQIYRINENGEYSVNFGKKMFPDMRRQTGCYYAIPGEWLSREPRRSRITLMINNAKDRVASIFGDGS